MISAANPSSCFTTNLLQLQRQFFQSSTIFLLTQSQNVLFKPNRAHAAFAASPPRPSSPRRDQRTTRSSLLRQGPILLTHFSILFSLIPLFFLTCFLWLFERRLLRIWGFVFRSTIFKKSARASYFLETVLRPIRCVGAYGLYCETLL